MASSSVDDKHSKHYIDLLAVIALIAPFYFTITLIPFSEHYRFEIVGILWSFVQWADSGVSGSGFIVLDPLLVSVAFLFSIFRIEFIIAIKKHQKGLVSQQVVWASAVLSQIPMIAFLFVPFFMNGIGGPIPILLVIGLIIDRKLGIEPPTSPWANKSSKTATE